MVHAAGHACVAHVTPASQSGDPPMPSGMHDLPAVEPPWQSVTLVGGHGSGMTGNDALSRIAAVMPPRKVISAPGIQMLSLARSCRRQSTLSVSGSGLPVPGSGGAPIGLVSAGVPSMTHQRSGTASTSPACAGAAAPARRTATSAATLKTRRPEYSRGEEDTRKLFMATLQRVVAVCAGVRLKS